MGWEKNCGGPGRLTRVPGSFQPVASSLKLGTTQGCLKALKEQSQFPTAPGNSTGLQTSQRIFSVLDPRAGMPSMGLKPLIS